MNREEFMEHLRAGRPATVAVKEITGIRPRIVTIADLENELTYKRYGVMMAGKKMVAIVVLELTVKQVPAAFLDRVKEGEPAGLVFAGMKRENFAYEYPRAIRAWALLFWSERCIGRADEIFTESLFPA